MARTGMDGVEAVEEERIRGVVRRLHAQLGERVPEPVVESAVRDSFARLQDARVRDFIPILAEKLARERLGARVGGGTTAGIASAS